MDTKKKEYEFDEESEHETSSCLSSDSDSDDSDRSENSDAESCKTSNTTKSIEKTTDKIIHELESSLKVLAELNEHSMTKLIEKAVLSEFESVSFLGSSSFGSNKFKVKDDFKRKMAEIGMKVDNYYTFGKFCDFLTDYILSNKLSDENSLIYPDKFLCDLLEIDEKPCTYIKIMGASRKVFE